MTDVFSKARRSEIMSHIRSKNTSPELVFFEAARALYAAGFHYRKHPANVYGRPDLSIPRYKVAVFVDSEFWHGKDFHVWEKRLPETYWRAKIRRNVLRDKAVNKRLRKDGWSVVRLWAKDVVRDPSRAVLLVQRRIIAKCDKAESP